MHPTYLYETISSTPTPNITDASKCEYKTRWCDSSESFQEIANVSEMKNPCKVNQPLLGGQKGAVLCQPICSVVLGDAIMHWQTRFNHKDPYLKKKKIKNQNPEWQQQQKKSQLFQTCNSFTEVVSYWKVKLSNDSMAVLSSVLYSIIIYHPKLLHLDCCSCSSWDQ